MWITCVLPESQPERRLCDLDELTEDGRDQLDLDI